MSEQKKMVIVIASGLDDERSSVAWSVANGGIKSGQDVTVFLTASAVDWVRKGAADRVHLNPLDPPIREMIEMVREKGNAIMVCPPCAEVRGYTQDDFLPGVIITGSLAIHKLIQEGASTLCF